MTKDFMGDITLSKLPPTPTEPVKWEAELRYRNEDGTYSIFRGTANEPGAALSALASEISYQRLFTGK